MTGAAELELKFPCVPLFQTKFLRFVQEQSFERIGGDRTIQVDARIIAASKKELRPTWFSTRFRCDRSHRHGIVELGCLNEGRSWLLNK